MLLLKKTKALEESYEYLYEHNRPVFVKLKAEPDNPYDRNAIAVTGNLRGEGSLTNFFFQMEHKAKLKILEGCVKVKTKQFPWGGMDIFRDHTFCNYCG